MSDSKERVGGVCRTCGRTSLEHAGGKCPQPESADDVLRDMLKALPVLRNVLNTAGLAGADVAEQLHARAQAAVARAQQQAASVPANLLEQLQAQMHYPACWDTAAYPTFADALNEALEGQGCSACNVKLSISHHPTPTAPADVMADADPLQGAVDWLVKAIDGCKLADIQRNLLIGYNRASRLLDAARAAKREERHEPD